MEEEKFEVFLFCLIFTFKDEPIYHVPGTIQDIFICHNLMLSLRSNPVLRPLNSALFSLPKIIKRRLLKVN